jgi:hypothetical protein
MQILSDPERGVFYLVDRDPRRPAIRTFDARSLVERGERRFAMTLPPFQMVLAD